MNDPRCIFCGAGTVPMILGGEVTAWGCLYCRSKKTGNAMVVETCESKLFEKGTLVFEYIDGRVPFLGSRVMWCPDGLLFVVEWERV